MNIVLIEDDPVDRKLACAVLSSSGHSIREHMTAEEAIQGIEADKPELILIDLRLPGMDGIEFIKKLKQNAAVSDIPVVAMTAFPAQFKKAEVLAAGCAAYLIKPLDTRALPQTLAETVSKKT